MSDSIEELLLVWQEAQAEGRHLSAEELAANRPELTAELSKRIAVLRNMEKLAGAAVQRKSPLDSTGAFQSFESTAPPFGNPHSFSNEICLGRKFGEYELIEKLGQGGMGVVYKARQLKAGGRLVALKLIRSDRFSSHIPEQQAEALARFRAEAMAAARLDHDHVAAVFDVGEVEGQPYFSMRYVEGGSLFERLREGPLDNRTAATYLEQIARGLTAAHSAGILHRDLKPQNILIDSKSDRALLTDFGLAKISSENQQLTMTEAIFGTPPYMSPEQAIDSRTVNFASDIYGLGAVLYHVLTGRPPFQAATSLETLRLVRENEPVPPRQLNPLIDADLETICLKCLEKEPGRRYASASELAEELARYLRQEPILARPIGAAEHFWRWCRKYPVVAGLSSGIFLLLVISLIGAIYAAVNISASADLANSRLDESTKANKAAIRAQKDAEGSAKKARLQKGAQSSQIGVQLLQKNELPDALLWFSDAWANSEEDSQLAKIHRYRIGKLLERIPLQDAWFHVREVVFSHDGRLVALLSDVGTIRVIELSTKKLIALLKHGSPVLTAAFSRDGKRLVSAAYDKTLRLWNVDRGTLEGKSLNLPGAPRQLAFSEGNDSIALLDWDDNLLQIPADLANISSVLPVGRVLGVHPNGMKFAARSDMRKVRLVSMTGKLLKESAALAGEGELFGSFSSNGDCFGWFAAGETKVVIWSGEKGEIEKSLAFESPIDLLFLGPGAEYVAGHKWPRDGAAGGLQIRRLETGPLAFDWPENSYIQSVAITGDGTMFVLTRFNDHNDIRVYSLSGGSAILTATWPLADRDIIAGVSLKISPESKWLFSIVSGDLRLWSLPYLGTHSWPLKQSGRTTRIFQGANASILYDVSDEANITSWSLPTGIREKPKSLVLASQEVKVPVVVNCAIPSFSNDIAGGQLARLGGASAPTAQPYAEAKTVWFDRADKYSPAPLAIQFGGDPRSTETPLDAKSSDFFFPFGIRVVPRLSPDGSLAAITPVNSERFQIWQLKDRAYLSSPIEGISDRSVAAFGPQNQLLAILRPGTDIRLFDTRSGEQLLPPLPAGNSSNVWFNRDGAYLLEVDDRIDFISEAEQTSPSSPRPAGDDEKSADVSPRIAVWNIAPHPVELRHERGEWLEFLAARRINARLGIDRLTSPELFRIWRKWKVDTSSDKLTPSEQEAIDLHDPAIDPLAALVPKAPTP